MLFDLKNAPGFRLNSRKIFEYSGILGQSGAAFCFPDSQGAKATGRMTTSINVLSTAWESEAPRAVSLCANERFSRFHVVDGYNPQEFTPEAYPPSPQSLMQYQSMRGR